MKNVPEKFPMKYLIIAELTEIAQKEIKKRIKAFEGIFIPKIQKMDDVLNNFANPAFQIFLHEANKTAAQTDRQGDYELLSELLLKRIENGNDKITSNSAIKKAVQVVNEISDDSLIVLTVILAINYIPQHQNIFLGLNFLDDLFKKILYRPLPPSKNTEWRDNLETVGAIRISSIAKLIPLEQIYSNSLSGYCTAGIKKQSETHKKAVAMLKKSQLPANLLLCDNELDKNYVRLPVATEQGIENLALTYNFPIKDCQQTENFSKILTEEQKEILHKIFSMYDRDMKISDSIKEKFYKEIRSRENLQTVLEWWNNVSIAFELTSVGRALAYSNLKRIAPSLSIWK